MSSADGWVSDSETWKAPARLGSKHFHDGVNSAFERNEPNETIIVETTAPL